EFRRVLFRSASGHKKDTRVGTLPLGDGWSKRFQAYTTSGPCHGAAGRCGGNSIIVDSGANGHHEVASIERAVRGFDPGGLLLADEPRGTSHQVGEAARDVGGLQRLALGR